MLPNSPRPRFVRSAPLGLLCIALLPFAVGQKQNATPDAGLSEVHIAVHVETEYGNPIGNLTANSFHVTIKGQPVPFEVNRPPTHRVGTAGSLPTRLLILLSPSEGQVGGRRMDALADKVKPLWKEGWQVSVLDAKGTQTLYATSDRELREALDRGEGKTSTITNASAELAQFTGRRVIFVLTGQGYVVDGNTIRAANMAGAKIYHVGGDPWKNFVPGGSRPATEFIAFNSAGEVTASAIDPGSPSFYRVSGIVTEERKFAGARNNALIDGLGYYDLKAMLPVTATTLDLSVEIHGGEGVSSLVGAQPYANGRTPPSLTISQRK